jgi:hypothetical protein
MNIKSVKLMLFGVIFALGAATIVVTLANGGTITSRGILFGSILCLMAAIRLYLSARHNA